MQTGSSETLIGWKTGKTTEYVWLCFRLRMLGRLAVKLFWWLLSRGWLPDSVLRKCCVHHLRDLVITLSCFPLLVLSLTSFASSVSCFLWNWFHLLLCLLTDYCTFCFFCFLLPSELFSFALVSPDSLLLLLFLASFGTGFICSCVSFCCFCLLPTFELI